MRFERPGLRRLAGPAGLLLAWPTVLRAENDVDSQLRALADLLKPERIALGILTIIAMLLLVKGLRRLSDRVQGWLPDRRLLILQLATIGVFAIYILGSVFLITAVLDPSRQALLAIGGSLAVAAGLALKDLVSSLIAGVVLLFDRPFWVGDRIRVGEVYGDVQAISLRATRIVTLDDNLVTIPNNTLLQDVVASGNAGAMDMMAVTPIHVALGADLDQAVAICREAAWTSRFIALGRPLAITIDEVAYGRLVCHRISVKAYVLATAYERAFNTDLTRRIDAGFLQHGIERPV